jgi:hypothetical protein
MRYGSETEKEYSKKHKSTNDQIQLTATVFLVFVFVGFGPQKKTTKK